MARTRAIVGYRESVLLAPGSYGEKIVERPLRGTVEKLSQKMEMGEKVNNDLSINNTLSLVADAYAREHFAAIVYVAWMGSLWTVSSVKVERPRLILQMGGIYNGERPSETPDAP